MKQFIIVTALLFIPLYSVYAHPGRTAGDGCHYCRTNCASRGEVQDARHCHNQEITTPTYTPPPQPKYTPPPLPKSEPAEITCNSNQCKSNNTCYNLPAHAHCTPNDNYNIWKCDTGYEENNNTCIKIVIPEPEVQVNNFASPVEEEVVTHSSTNGSGQNHNSGSGGAGIVTILALLGGARRIYSKKGQ